METFAPVEVKPCNPAELTPALNPILITSETQLGLLEKFFARVPLFGLDIETNVVDDFTQRRIRTIQIGDRHEQFVIDLLAFAPEGLFDLQGPISNGMGWNPTGVARGPLKSIVRVLRPFLESKLYLKVGHYLQFEYEVIKLTLGIRCWNFYDTIIGEKLRFAGLVNPFMHGYWALDDLARRYCRLDISKAEQKSFDLTSPLTDSQIIYAALDVRLPIAIKVAQQAELERLGLMRAAQIEFDAIPAFGDMHLNGIGIDVDRWTAMVGTVESAHMQNTTLLDTLLVPKLGSKRVPENDDEELARLFAIWKAAPKGKAKEPFRAWKHAESVSNKKKAMINTYPGEAPINYGSPSQMVKCLQSLGYKIDDTNEMSLKKIHNDPLIEALLTYRETEKALSTYGHEFLAKIHPLTKRIHSDISQIGTATGRTSSRNPNLQNIKQGSDYRSCFVAPPGHKLLTLDYNGAELRIAADYSQEPVWIQAFLQNWDVHSVGAEIIFGEEWKQGAEADCAYYASHHKCKCAKHVKLREKTKAVQFGILYGKGSRNLAIDLDIPEAEARKLLDTYKKSFPVLIKCLQDMGLAATKPQNDKRLVARSKSNRARFFTIPDPQFAMKRAKEKYGVKTTKAQINSELKGLFSSIEREGRNMGIQATNADMIKLAMGCGSDKQSKEYLWQQLERDYNAKLVLMVHDELVVEVEDSYAEEVKAVVTDCMVRGGEEFIKSIPTVVEGKINEVWAK